LLNKHLWRYQLAGLSDIRRCIAVDLLAHGDTVIKPDQDVSVTANAAMLREVLDALKIDQVDLVGNDSGGGIAQIFAALHPDRVRYQQVADEGAKPLLRFEPAVDLWADEKKVPAPTRRSYKARMHSGLQTRPEPSSARRDNTPHP
jgi:pimeloyl-ACP methyl ester carboxylesterase